jgi:hypothetical protein
MGSKIHNNSRHMLFQIDQFERRRYRVNNFSDKINFSTKNLQNILGSLRSGLKQEKVLNLTFLFFDQNSVSKYYNNFKFLN